MAAAPDTSSPYHPAIKPPRFAPPAGSWDTQIHVYVPGGKAADPKGAYAPIEAPLAAANAMHAKLGIARGVLVQNVSERVDYDLLIADLQANPRLRGVVTLRPDATDSELERLHRAGVRGIRFHFLPRVNQAPSMDYFQWAAARVAPLGWHMVVNMTPEFLDELGPVLCKLVMPVLVNHQAHIAVAHGLDQPGLRALLELQHSENIWVQLSAGDRHSAVGRPHYADVAPLSLALARNAPQRVVWATDWPHPLYERIGIAEAKPDDGDLLNLLYDSVDGDQDLLAAILVHNPARLYA